MTDAPTPHSEDAASRVFAIRIVGPAQEDIDAAHAHFAATAGLGIADEWQDGFFDAIRQLATMPRKHSIATESRFFAEEIRQLVYRRRPYSPAYRVLFTVVESQEEAPFIRIIHVRHGAQRPMTRAGARERQRAIEASE